MIGPIYSMIEAGPSSRIEKKIFKDATKILAKLKDV